MRISVAMASYNGAEYIEEQLKSILVQLTQEDEVIVSDDGSTDQTRNIISGICAEDSRVRLIDGPKQGLIYNFENALLHCKGDFIFLADQDDIWRPNKVEKVMECFEDESVTLVLHDAQMVDNGMHMLAPSFFDYRGVRTGYYSNIFKNSYIGCCMAFRGSMLKYALPFPKKIPMHDQWIALLSEKYGKNFLLSEKLLDYRRHEGTATKNHHSSVWKMIGYRMQIITALRKRVREIKKEA